ncbi:MAG: 50S ribosomal protein L32 [Synergistaceae bacterium]|jgi:large subunit ribosomal protein L32|nr:50S ribosomal protein L32 [Synergistaceae bacterium]
MATPKRRTSHARTAQRKAQWLGALSAPETAKCPHCGEPVMSHRACPSCGYYRGRAIVEVKEPA